jgi:UDP-N-acetylglucosamine--N-acetylmuramyl-(pentapeptide) pyrophosphoryl-undecaprenol N-acetylglucosamine transferase
MTFFKKEGWQELNSPSEPRSDEPARLRICLAASGGGHIRQLLDLEKAWSNHDYFFVSEDTALSRSLKSTHPVHFLRHFALGQIKQDGLGGAISAGIRNFWNSTRIALKYRPDIIISTGAGTVFFLVLWGKLLGAKFILIETFARFEKPSAFARMAAPFADHIIVQSAALAKAFPNATVFDPLEILDLPRPKKKSLLFATVGVTLPFDRMIDMVAKLKADGRIPEDVIAQSGIGGIMPNGIETFETLSFDRIKSLLQDADIVVCHGGTGSVITALREGCRTIVVPRAFTLGEHYDDHQEEITNAFAARGLIIAASSIQELASALEIARSRTPVSATTNPVRLVEHLRNLLSQLADTGKI